MPAFNDGFLDLPARPPKPRTKGLTHVIDKGLNLRDIEGLFDTAGEFVDIVKLGWGTSYVTNNLEKKIALYRSFDTPVVCGGTLFEAVYGRGKLDEFKSWLKEFRFSHVEISDGTLDIPRERKLELIDEFARDFTVLSEVGSKDEDVVYAPYQWVEWIKEELEAGAWKGITEGREGGTAGIYRSDGEMRTGLVDEIVHEVDVSNLVFEAPQKSSQAWFVKQFGPNVNLGNIPPEEVIPLETLRLGLRGDSLKEVLLDGERTAPERARALRRLDLRDPPRPVAEPLGHFEGAVVGALRRLEAAPARRLGREARLGVHHRQRDPVQPAPRRRLPLDRLHPVHPADDAGGGGARRPLGRLRQAGVRHPPRHACRRHMTNHIHAPEHPESESVRGGGFTL